MRKLRFIRAVLSDLVFIPLFGFCAIYAPLVIYGLQMAKGQARLIIGAREVTEVLVDPLVADSVKTKLELIGEIRQFAFDSIGLDVNENYTTFYDQQGRRLMYVVTACEPFALEPHHWHFPILGDVPYKGFFDEERAKEEAAKWKAEGYDTDIGGASGWSTLGILKDPVLSQMLRYREGDLAELIIHELTHGTLFVKDDVDFNENLASFIGYKGALWFLESKYGKHSKQYRDYVNGRKDDETLEKFMLACTKSLDSLYKNFPPRTDTTGKRGLKERMFKRFANDARKLPLEADTLFYKRLEKRMMESGNTFFMQYVRYGAKQQDFEDNFQRAGGDLRKYLDEMRKLYGKNRAV